MDDQGDDLSHADQRLLACERLAEELRRSIVARRDGAGAAHFRARYARLQREIATWRWYRACVARRIEDRPN